ncbi:hypothetical protein ALC62_11793 [Cyphomyrmex costatus]|uniref:Ig-like domain-containing protein n=1 Tax=Cyphomyrmex costatus TaxID=456900 RepID=A0A195C9G0_9HYME|nr:hypothetical protein ALC62_11793 [Cyphomyrmex costatus]
MYRVACTRILERLKLIRSITRSFFWFADVPSFSEPIGNVTAAIGKEVALSCTIRKVGNYKEFSQETRLDSARRGASTLAAEQAPSAN